MTPAPDKAVVLAAGLGTRMMPLTRVVAKPLLPLWGVPMLEHALRALRGWGVGEVLINCHHRAGDVAAFAASRPVPGLRVAISYEPEILGTGGALHRAGWFPDVRPFWLLNADVALDLDPGPLLAARVGGRTIAALWVHPERGPRTVEVGDGQVRSFRSATPGAPGTFTFTGLHLVSPEILRFIPPGFSSIITAYEAALAAGRRIRAVVAEDAYWADIGSPDQYLAAHREVAARHAAGLRGGGLLVPGRAPRAPAGAVVENSVVLPGAEVRPEARLRDAIVAPGVRVAGPASGIVMAAADGLEPVELRALERVLGGLAGAVMQRAARSGSARTYTRVRRGRRGVVLVRYTDERPENALYAGHARFLARHGIPVPRVLFDQPRHRLSLFEDAGDVSLTALVRRGTPRGIEAAYRAVLATMRRLHRLRPGARRLMAPFSPALYRWEHDLFIAEFLGRQPGVGERDMRAVRRDLGRVARALEDTPRVLLHRDLQSSNVLRHRGRYVLIDFQGMRMGPAAYDVASLLCDPYVSLPLDLQLRLAGDTPLFWEAAVQRLAQALGAFGRLSRLPGGQPFAAWIPAGLDMLHRALDHCGLPLDALRAVLARR